MPTHVYADALARIDALAGVVKLEFVSHVPGRGAAEAGGDPGAEADAYGPEPCLRLVMEPGALARLHAQMQSLLAELDRAGMIERKAAGNGHRTG